MKNNFYKRMALLLAAAVAVSSGSGSALTAQAEEGYVTDAMLSDADVAEPTKDEVIPDANQYRYQKEELSAFCHFGPNTFNEIEWGEYYGSKTPAQIFTLKKDFDAETMVSALKEAGFEKLIVTAKHHDGFCIWDSQWTDYDVAASDYEDANGQSDILAEISAACTEYDMDMGLYLSPWDIHDDSYGYYDANGNATTEANDVLDYNDYYNNQLEEILGNDKYGNDGHFTEVWMDGAKGSGANAQEYDFQRWFATIQKNEGIEAGYDADCMLFGAESYTTVRWIGNENGYANEETWAKSKINREANTIDNKSQGGYTIGYEDGNQWTVPEADARITSGWFWGTYKNTPKSIADLGNMYFGSVGHNSTFLLNVPPNNQGTIDDAILERVEEFGEEVKSTFKTNFAAEAAVSATEVRGNDTSYKPSNMIDGDDATYWTTNDGTTTGTILVELGETKTFDVVSIEEAIQFGQRITSFSVEYRKDGEWKSFDQGTTIGAKRLSRKAPVKADAVRITVSTESDVIAEENVPMISEIGVYKASLGFELASAAPEGMDVIDINDQAFTFTGTWNPETGTQYVNGTNTWANGNSAGTVTATVNFTGSQITLIGTKDPNHGTADIYIDDEKVASIDTGVSPRKVGQAIFESDTLEAGEHTLKLVATNKAIGLEAAYVINNDGLGMIGFENASYTMEEDSTMMVKLLRVGGTSGEATVTVTPNPGSAIQDDFDTENIVTVTFADGETEKEIPVITTRNTNKTGEQYFTVELSSDNEDLILGLNGKARINILDEESLAQEVVGDCFTEENPFVMPTEVGGQETLEAEHMELHNTGEGEAWPMTVTESSWASGGKFLNAMNSGDSATLYYYAAKAGTYKVTLDLRSGDSRNGLTWSDAAGKVEEGAAENIGADDSAGATHEATFEIVIKRPGAGAITFAAGQYNAPQMDKFEIELLEVIEPTVIALEHYVEATAGDEETEGGAAEGPASLVLDNDPDTKWHTDWYVGASHDNHWVQVELDGIYDVEGFRYLPRQDSSPNGRITEYEIQVSLDGETFETVASGEWATDTDWKDVYFDVTPAKYVRLQTISATSDQSLLFSSAAEIRVIGELSDVVLCDHENTEEVAGKEATCTEDGVTAAVKCTECGKVLEGGEVIPAAGHDWSEAVVTKEATCTEDGESTKSCANCTETETTVIKATGHKWGEWTVVEEPTVDAEGKESRTCENCQATESRAIEKLDPQPQPTVNPFTDVTEADYFYDAVLWAVENKVTTGDTETLFAPYKECNRAQIVLFLYRAMGGEAADAENPFSDVSEADYCYDAVLWAVENGITTGITATTFEPWKACTRAEIVTFLWRAMGSEEVEAEEAFADVNEADFFYDAVLWAVENGVTTGLDDTTFGAWDNCFRCDAVTFIQRAVEK